MTRNQLVSMLDRRRKEKMARSPHAFVRGNTAKFYEWLADDANAIHVGPPVWICGDCHVGNLGPIANSDGRVAIRIRDLDQGVIGNPAHDLIRLGLSLATVARNSVLPGMTTARMIETLSQGYLRGLVSRETMDTSSAPSIHIVFKEALRRRWRDLAKDRIDDRTRSIPRGGSFVAIGAGTYRQIGTAIHDADLQRLITALTARDANDSIEIHDAAYWIKGCSSLGLNRYAVLVRVGKRSANRHGACLLDFKQASVPLAPVATGFQLPTDQATRVIEAARALSPTLGGRMARAQIGASSMFVRELLPQDLKIEIEKLDEDEAAAAAFLLAGVVGQAHGRQMERRDRVAWSKTLRQATTKSLDAPSWLWRAVVKQLARHEEGYLAHCRDQLRHGTGKKRAQRNQSR